MLAEAQHTTFRAQPIALADLKPCRCCGETEHLAVDEGGAEMQFLFDAAVAIVRDAKGEPVDFTDDMVQCRVCDAWAPAFYWNASPETAAMARLATLAAWDEYDDSGVWMGVRQ